MRSTDRRHRTTLDTAVPVETLGQPQHLEAPSVPQHPETLGQPQHPEAPSVPQHPEALGEPQHPETLGDRRRPGKVGDPLRLGNVGDPRRLGVLGVPLDASAGAAERADAGVAVLIIEDHGLMAQTLAIALNAEGCHARVAELVGPAALLAEVRIHRPGVVLLDLDLGEFGDGVELVAPLTELGARVLVVSGTSDRIRLAETVERGAIGFLSKQVPFEELLATVLDVVAQRPILSTAQRFALMAELRAARAARTRDLAPFLTLTPRERAVLSALAKGQRAETIAEDAVVSEATVRSQIRGVLAKLGVNSQLAAVALAWTVGWFPNEPP